MPARINNSQNLREPPTRNFFTLRSSYRKGSELRGADHRKSRTHIFSRLIVCLPSSLFFLFSSSTCLAPVSIASLNDLMSSRLHSSRLNLISFQFTTGLKPFNWKDKSILTAKTTWQTSRYLMTRSTQQSAGEQRSSYDGKNNNQLYRNFIKFTKSLPFSSLYTFNVPYNFAKDIDSFVKKWGVYNENQECTESDSEVTESFNS